MLLDLAVYLVAVLLSIPLLVFGLECLAALPRSSRRQDVSVTPRPSVAVLIPAHDEEAGIEDTLTEILAQLEPCDRLLVVADNCTDGTAVAARRAGAEVVERADLERRGKGYALAHGLQHLQADPRDVLILLDADSLCGPNLLDVLSRLTLQTGRPVQASYLFDPPPKAGLKERFSALAIRVKNHVRLLGLRRLGGASHLTGTGMAFPFSLLGPDQLASGHLTEDMELGLRLAERGYPPLFCDQVQVLGVLPSQDRAAKTQRTRWEHGHLGLLLGRGPILLLRSVASLRWSAVALALDLLVPPLSLLVMLAMVGLAASIAHAALGGSPGPLGVLSLGSVLAALGFLGAWLRFGRDLLSFPELVRVPLYILWKIPVYFRFLTRREKTWIRTEREPTSSPR